MFSLFFLFGSLLWLACIQTDFYLLPPTIVCAQSHVCVSQNGRVVFALGSVAEPISNTAHCLAQTP